jgi:hypothetical protein
MPDAFSMNSTLECPSAVACRLDLGGVLGVYRST